MLTIDQLPEPHTLIATADGGCTCLMFYFLPENASFEEVCNEHGYDYRYLHLNNDSDAPEELSERYEDGDSDVVRDWIPAIPEGWMLAGKGDSEDGPVAVFVRRTSGSDKADEAS